MERANLSAGWALLLLCAGYPLGAAGQTASTRPASSPDPAEASRWASLPTDRSLREDSGLPADQVLPSEIAPTPGGPPRDIASLLRPRVELSAEWEPEVDGVALGSYDVSVQMPIYPIFGPPPPLITSGYTFTQLEAPVQMDLPSSLHEVALGTAWMRRINDRWMARFMLSGAFASDLENTSSEAWQLRVGGFAIYRPNAQWSFTVGALATGRDDIPVLPAIGAIWEPSPEVIVNLMLPRPRISVLLADRGDRQHWGYFGGGISGGAWAYDRASGQGDKLNYREWRIVLGWESKRPQPPGTFRPSGTTFNAEVGYVLGRQFEFESNAPDISIGDALLLRAGVGF
jgi:hypothetical protein